MTAIQGRHLPMTVSGFCCEFNMPKAIKSRYDENSKEVSNSLPEYNIRKTYLVDRYEACPENWMRSSGSISSYFVAVEDNHGMWLDFNGNLRHAHHLAVVISVQGINAITGQKVDGVHLEQYKHNCPVHNVAFGHERYCEKCGYKWPPQNYLTTTATPNRMFWLDGFRSAEGVIRQYVFTQDTERGVAAQVIGDERVFAIGVAFFLSKEPKPVVSSPTSSFLSRGEGHVVKRMSMFRIPAPEVAAGAKVRQQVYEDNEPVTFYRDECSGQIVINYLFEADVEAILKGGRKDLDGDGEGFMRDMKVGNSPPC